MAAPPSSSLILLSLTTVLLFSGLLLAEAQSAPAPAPSGPVNITAILEKAGQFSTFNRFLNMTQADNQINNQANNSRDGVTVFAFNDNAFNSLPPGTLNNLSYQQQVQLVLYHITPKYYTLESLLTVSNPVRTLSSGQDGRVYGLNFTGQGNQVNVSTGMVHVPIQNTISKDFPLAVYQVDKVLLPVEFYEAKAPAASPPPKSGGSGSSNATAPSTSNPDGNGSGRSLSGMGLGLVSAIWLFCMGVLF